MKKILFLIISLSFILSGCKNTSPEVTPVTTGLNFIAEISYLGETYTYNVLVDNNLNLEMYSISEPVTKYFFSGDKITISHKNISHETEISSINSGLTLDFLYEVFKTINKSNSKTITDENHHYLKIETKKYKYKYYFGMSGLPIKITESNFGITVTIKNASITKPTQ